MHQEHQSSQLRGHFPHSDTPTPLNRLCGFSLRQGREPPAGVAVPLKAGRRQGHIEGSSQTVLKHAEGVPALGKDCRALRVRPWDEMPYPVDCAGWSLDLLPDSPKTSRAMRNMSAFHSGTGKGHG